MSEQLVPFQGAAPVVTSVPVPPGGFLPDGSSVNPDPNGSTLLVTSPKKSKRIWLIAIVLVVVAALAVGVFWILNRSQFSEPWTRLESRETSTAMLYPGMPLCGSTVDSSVPIYQCRVFTDDGAGWLMILIYQYPVDAVDFSQLNMADTLPKYVKYTADTKGDTINSVLPLGTYRSYPSLDAVLTRPSLDGPASAMHMRLIMKDNWLYVIESLGVSQREFDRFANSLEFLP
jgi:hypothetical protein